MSKKNKKPVLTRRKFLRSAAGATLFSAGLPYIISSQGMAKTQTTAFGEKVSGKLIRLDSHVHVFEWNKAVIQSLRGYVAQQQLTHFVALVKDAVLAKAVGQFDQTGAKVIIFQWINVGKAEPGWPSVAEDFHPEGPAAGFKIHPRQTKSKNGGFFTVTEQTMGKVCDAAARAGKPLLFHTDADAPNPCSLPMLAELAMNHPDATCVAAHLGVYTQEYYIREYTPQEWTQRAEAAFKQNLQLLLDIRNLYADTTLFGVDFPARSPDPDFKFKLFARITGTLGKAARKALVRKLVIGTDFPCFYVADNPKSKYLYQARCMRTIFREDFDETRMAMNFINLLPEEFAVKYL